MPEDEDQQEREAPQPDPQPAEPDNPLGDAGKKALEAERKARRDAEARLKQLEQTLAERADAEKSELEKLTDKLGEAQTNATSAAQSLMRLEVALEKAPDGMGISQVRKLAKRLSGDTREALEADAEELFGEFGAGQPPSGQPTPKPKGGNNPAADDESVDADAIAERIAARPW